MPILIGESQLEVNASKILGQALWLEPGLKISQLYCKTTARSPIFADFPHKSNGLLSRRFLLLILVSQNLPRK